MSTTYQPQHYTQGILPGECIDYVKYLDFCRGNVIKYLWRYKQKNGKEDMKKAAQYLKYIVYNPGVITGEMPSEVLEKFNKECKDILQHSDQRGTQKYDFVSCIYMLGNIEPQRANDNDVALAAQIYQRVVEEHIND